MVFGGKGLGGSSVRREKVEWTWNGGRYCEVYVLKPAV